MYTHIPVQGTCQPSVKNNFFLGGSLGSFISLTFVAAVFCCGREPLVFVGPCKSGSLMRIYYLLS